MTEDIPDHSLNLHVFHHLLQARCITMYCGKMIILMTGDDKIPLHIQDSLVCENGSNWHQIVKIEKT